MNLLSQISQFDTFLEGITNRSNNAVMPRLFDEMSGPDQHIELMYYFMNDQGQFRRDRADDMRKALHDHLNPYDVHRALGSQDGTKLLQLIHTALGKHLAAAIDKENEK